MECAICLEEKSQFKVLHCEHIFCEKCIEDLGSGIPQTATESTTNLKPSKTNESSIKEIPKDTSTLSIECPKCRRITKLDISTGGYSKLGIKYFGQLHCLQCDEYKSVCEFRWCHECSTSVCSKCYMDKHVSTSTDGKICGLHSVAKWDTDYPAVRFCLEQLRLERENIKDKATKAKDYVKSYFEGLQEYMSLEIDQKTTACENDYRDKIKTLSEAYGIDLRTVQPATKLNRSYQSMLGPLYELSHRELRSANCQRYSYNINSIPYKDIAKYLLAPIKLPAEGRLFFDTARISKKLCNESIVIGANVIKQPSDICLIPSAENEPSKFILISDYEAGIFLFKFPTLQLQGPLPLKQAYARYGRIAVVGDSMDSLNSGTGLHDPTFKDGRPKNVTLMVTCQANPNGHWFYILINFSLDCSKHEHMQINKNHHHSFPGNEKLHIQSSRRSLFGLSSASYALWRFKGIQEMIWKEVYTVITHGNLKPYCQIGPICDYTDHTKVLITSGAWQTVDVVKFGWPDDRLWSVQRIEISRLISNQSISTSFIEPALFSCWNSDADRAIFVDKKQSFISYFDQPANDFCELVRFNVKIPQKVLFIDTNSFLLIVQHKDYQQIRALELYA